MSEAPQPTPQSPTCRQEPALLGLVTNLVGPGDQQDLGAWVLRVGSGLNEDGLHSHGAVGKVLHAVVLEDAVGKFGQAPPPPAGAPPSGPEGAGPAHLFRWL